MSPWQGASLISCFYLLRHGLRAEPAQSLTSCASSGGTPRPDRSILFRISFSPVLLYVLKSKTLNAFRNAFLRADATVPLIWYSFRRAFPIPFVEQAVPWRRVQALPCHRSLNRIAYDPTRMTACEVRWKVQKLYVAGVMSIRMIGSVKIIFVFCDSIK